MDTQQRLPHVGIDVGERLDRKRRRYAGCVLKGCSESVVGELLHPAVRVVDEHHVTGAQHALGDSQRANHVIGYDSAGVAKDVRVAERQTQCGEHIHARVHARHNGELPRRTDIDVSSRAPGGEARVVLHQLIDHIHLTCLDTVTTTWIDL